MINKDMDMRIFFAKNIFYLNKKQNNPIFACFELLTISF
jgi:hypothetical protein